jgi:Flp pilus assembly protein TadD
MSSRSRVVVLLALAGVASVAIAIGFNSLRSNGTEPSDASLASSDSRPQAGGGLPTGAVTPVGDRVAGETSTSVMTQTDQSQDPDARRTARALVREARSLLDQGQAAPAESLVLRALGLAPQHGGAWNVLGRAQLALGRDDEAQTSFSRACEVDSSNAWAHNNLGYLYLQQGEAAEAAPWLETAVRLRSDVAVFHNNLGCAYERLHRLEDAAHEYSRAVDLQPNHATASEALARVNARLQPALAEAENTPDSIASRPVEENR